MAQFTNQATLLYNGIRADSNIVTGEITRVISLWKDATVETYQVGEVLTYVVSMQNSGCAPLTGLTLTDDLGKYTFGAQSLVPLTYTGDPVLYYINGIRQNAPAVSAGPPLVISGISVPGNSSVILIYRARVNSCAPPEAGATIENTATLTGTGITEEVTATETVTPELTPRLTITKAIDSPTVVENGEVTYTLTIQNTGAAPADAAAGIVISDAFNPILCNISVTLNGVELPAAGSYTYNEATGEFATIAGRITVPAATCSQNPATGSWTLVPGVTTLTITGTI